MFNLNLLVTKEMYLGGFQYQSLNILSILSIFTAIYVIITKNPIISVLFLIGLFVGIAIYLVLIGLSFLGLSYLLVYVGAISILFLFILMLLNVRVSELVNDTKNSIPLVFIAAILFSLPITDITSNNESIINIKSNFLTFLLNIFNNSKVVYFVFAQKWDDCLTPFNDINSIGTVMYTNFGILLIIVSLILLLAMVGTIVITLSYKDNSLIYSKDTNINSYEKLPLKSTN